MKKSISQNKKNVVSESKRIMYISDSDLEDLLELLFPNETELYVMFIVCFDESTSFGETIPVAAVGGAISTGKQWANLLKAWRKVLDSEKIEIFHTKDFETPEGRLGTIYENWSKERREAFSNAQIDAIIDNPLELFITMGVNLADFKAVLTPERKKVFKKSFANEYFFCAMMCMQNISYWVNETYGMNQRITYYLEAGGSHEKILAKAYDAMLAQEDVSNLAHLWLKPIFAPKDAQAGLQIADKILYEGVKHSSHYLHPDPPEKYSVVIDGKKRWDDRYFIKQIVPRGIVPNFRLLSKEQIEGEFLKLEAIHQMALEGKLKSRLIRFEDP